ncbi:MAG: exodeoxyribonuclease V subunit gamma [Gammaproteobacteria bacterium]
MLTLYYSNRLENLAAALAEAVRAPLTTPLASEVIIVQNLGMARWLSMVIASRLGVCANIRFPFPAAFVWEAIRALIEDVPETSAFDLPVLTWRVMGLLRALPDEPQYAELQAYLGAGDDDHCYELARRIAQCFDQYLVYRPDWVTAWENGEPSGDWQAPLWRALAAGEAKRHRVYHQRRFQRALADLRIAPPGWRRRLLVLGISAMPPAQFTILAQLGEFIDVTLFLLNPCREYWGDIVADRDIARRDADIDAENQYLQVGNPLLASLGKQGRDFIDLLQPYAANIIDDYADPPENTLLGCLQADILNLRRRGDAAFPATPFDPADRSVQIHACHSPLREAEVLHDQLLALFADHPDLRPADVVVMTPDIDAYAPFIEQVFANAEPAISYSIADRGASADQPLLDAFLEVLDLAQGRFDAARMLTVLETPALRRRFGLEEGGLGLITRWVREAGIRWGMDEANRAQWGLPAAREHTWRFGLDRLLLGFALPGGGQQSWADILPYDDIEGGDAQILGKLASFADAVFALHDDLAHARAIADWLSVLDRVIATFFAPDQYEEAQLQTIRNGLAAIAEQSRQAGFGASVSIGVVKAALRRAWENTTGPRGFFTGGVTFCTLMPMRSVPFQAVCLIGMNNDAYPRQQRPPDFDLMASAFRKGDRSRRNDDRYLFLEALLSARRCFYISYVGGDIRDNSVLPPSVLVNELLDVIQQGFLPPGPATDVRTALLVRHPLQPFSPRYFTGADPRLFSYQRALADACRQAGAERRDPPPFVDGVLAEPAPEFRDIEFDQFVDFFTNPARYWLRRRLNLQLGEGAAPLETREPFVLDGLGEYDLRTRLLPLLLADQPAEIGYAAARGSGLLPHGRVGERQFQQLWDNLKHYAGRLRKVLPRDHLPPLEVDIAVGAARLHGWLNGVSAQGLFDFRPATAKAKDRLRLWLRHLALNHIGPPTIAPDSVWIGLDGDLRLRPVADPDRHLRLLVDFYWEGLRRPLPFFPRSAYEFAIATRQPKAKSTPQAQAWQEWESNDYRPGEDINPYFQLAFRGCDNPLAGEFEELARAIFDPLLDHLHDRP